MRAWTPAAAVALAAALGVPLAGPTAASTARPGLTSDATGPLFTAGLLAPGVPLERCVRLTWSDAPGTTLGVSAAVTGDLAPFLDVTVQAGRGGGYGGCDDFVGTAPAWSGDLASLTGGHDVPERQVPLLPVPAADGTATVRLTMTVRSDDRAQARRAGGDLVFALVPGGAVPSQPPDDPTPAAAPDRSAPGATPTTAAVPADDGAAPPPSPSSAPTATTTAETTAPVPRGDATVTVPLSPGPPAGGADGAGAGLAATVQELLETAGRAAGAVTRAVGWTFWSAPIILLFLLVQNRIDARDPKLAEAPAQAVPGLAFDERYDATAALGVTRLPGVPR